jgi:cytochrome b561
MSTHSAPLDQARGSAAAATGAMRYSRTAVWLHWMIAALMFVTIPLGFYGANLEGEAAQGATNVHKLIGILILALTVVRIGWRLMHRPPPLPPAMAPGLRLLAVATHALFYVLLLVLPLSGWWMTSAFPGRHPIGIDGVIEAPFLPVELSMTAAGVAHQIHLTLGFVAIALILLHVSAALKHHFVDRDEILNRMLRRRRAAEE